MSEFPFIKQPQKKFVLIPLEFCLSFPYSKYETKNNIILPFIETQLIFSNMFDLPFLIHKKNGIFSP
jgi:hypothetical protein